MNPYRIETPAVISFSGGRTSGYMLWHILQAFSGTLPEGVKVIFCNTGKERPQTLDFVERCSLEWGVEIVWLEYRRDRDRPFVSPQNRLHIGCHDFTEVNYSTASRNGEPFDALIEVQTEFRRLSKGEGPSLPSRNGGRACTAELKLRTIRRWYESQGIDPTALQDAIGIRHDEPKRVAKIMRQTASEWEIGEPILPLHEAKVTEPMVMEFWANHPFDLQLKQHEGNCDLCMLKTKRKAITYLTHRRILRQVKTNL